MAVVVADLDPTPPKVALDLIEVAAAALGLFGAQEEVFLQLAQETCKK